MDTVNDVLNWINDLVWGGHDFLREFGILIPLLLGTGLYLTILLKGVQFTRLFHALWLALVKRKEEGAEGDIIHYQALTVALAATVGVGNIAGVGTAIALGGPGALFWMWITGLVGMATKYSEAWLGVKYREVDDKGEQGGGPMFYLTNGIRNNFGKVLGILFAAFGAIAAFGIGNMIQANSVAAALDEEWSIPAWLTGVVLMLIAAIVIIGGIKAIGRFTAAFVPFMAIFYCLAATVILVVNIAELPGALATIIGDAFTGSAAVGGFAGAAFLTVLRWGVARGMFSNESGLGTGGIAAAAAQTTNETRQALVSMTQTFLDTIVVVSFTGLVIVTTGVWETGETGAALTTIGFREGLPGEWGGAIVALGVAFFAFSTLLGWSYYGDRCVLYLFGYRAVMPYRVIFSAVIFIGAVAALETVWTFGDIMNGLMALPNLVGLILLSLVIKRGSFEFFSRPEWKLITVKPEPTTE
jgi:AGCS family alanine or glycine:cation symporter